MGFSEFQRLNKQLSSRLLGLDVSFEDDNLDDLFGGAVDTDDEEDADGDANTQGEADAESADSDALRSLRARERWREGVRKVVLLNRFLAVAKTSVLEQTAAWLDKFRRTLLYLVAGRVLDTPFEAVFVRASLGLRRIPEQSSWSALFFDGAPALALSTVISHTVESLPQLPLLRRPLGLQPSGSGNVKATVKSASSSSSSGARQQVVTAGAWAAKVLLAYPFEVAFARKVVLGQSLWAALRPSALLATATWNGVSGHIAQECGDVLLNQLFALWSSRQSQGDPGVDKQRAEQADGAQQGDEQGEQVSALAWVAYSVTSFVLSIPCFVVRDRIVVSAPDSLHPAPASAWTVAGEIYRAQGLGGFVTGAGTMAMLLVPMFCTYVGSQVLVHAIMGNTRREQFEEQVAEMRENLQLERREPIVVNDREHLETVVAMAAKRGRLLVLLVVNTSEESKHALAAARIYAQQLVATVIIGDTTRLPFLATLVQSARVPFVLPVLNGEVHVDSVLLFSKDQSSKVFAKLRKLADQANDATAH